MRRLLILILIPLNLTSFAQNKTSDYQKEIKLFLADILHDSTHYTFTDIIRDSIAASSSNNGATRTWHRKVDTIDYRYNIHAKYYRYHLNKIVVLENVIEASEPSLFIFEESDSTKISQLTPFLNEIDSNRIKEINGMFNKWTADYLDEKFITKENLKDLFQKDIEKGWKKYRKKYGAPYLSFSIPVFNSTYDIAYFSWSEVCGSLCGVGYSCFYRRINGKWVLVLIRKDWVS
jgi:hypothetical protein